MIPQILHILAKDIRRLRWEIAASIALVLVNGWVAGNNELFLFPWTFSNDSLLQLRRLGPVLVVAALVMQWVLTVSLIQGEVIPGVRQFWLTRPYRRGALLAAKLAFLLLFLLLPIAVADVVALSRAGTGLGGHAGALAWRLVLYFALILVPAMALALVTVNLAQVALGIVGVSLLAMMFSAVTMGAHGLISNGGLAWWSWAASLAVTAALSALLVYLAVFRRRHRAGIALILLANLAVHILPRVIDRSRSFGLQSRFAAEPGAGKALTFAPALSRGRYSGRDLDRNRFSAMAQFWIPVELGNSSGLETWAEFVDARLGDASTGRPIPGRLTAAIQYSGDGQSWLVLGLERGLADRLRSQTVRLEADAAITLLGATGSARIPFQPNAVQSAGALGVCVARVELPNLQLLCREPYGPRHIVRGALRDAVSGARSRQMHWMNHGVSYGPVHQSIAIEGPFSFLGGNFQLVPLRPGEDPPWDLSRLAQTEIELTTFVPLDHVRRAMRVEAIRLGDYEIVVEATRF